MPRKAITKPSNTPVPDKTLGRPVHKDTKVGFFELAPDWKEHWWGMPEFSIQNAMPQYRITVNFMTREDRDNFAKATGVPISPTTDTIWYPHQVKLNGAFEYNGPPTDSRYPICIPSKGRAEHQKTGKVLDRMGVTYRFFVEETEYDAYCKAIGEERVVSMPFHDLGQGSIPARNWIWEWAREREYKRHWTVDDNIVSFSRCTSNRRLCVRGGGFFLAMEDFVDRYENIAMAGPHHIGFVIDRSPSLTPFIANTRVYSCILLDTSLPDRWRGRYNEDTDLSLRLLKQGYCTIVFRALLMDKGGNTVGVRNAKPLPGGNTDNVYNTGDHRRAFAESLQQQHPDVVKVVWKFNRWHHEVDYRPFKRNKLKYKPGIVPHCLDNNYGMELVYAKDGRKV